MPNQLGQRPDGIELYLLEIDNSHFLQKIKLSPFNNNHDSQLWRGTRYKATHSKHFEGLLADLHASRLEHLDAAEVLDREGASAGPHSRLVGVPLVWARGLWRWALASAERLAERSPQPLHAGARRRQSTARATPAQRRTHWRLLKHHTFTTLANLHKHIIFIHELRITFIE